MLRFGWRDLRRALRPRSHRRDPVFYRWHRHVDDLAYEWQERQREHQLEEFAAPVRLRRAERTRPDRPAESPDIILLRDLPPDLDDEALRRHVADLVGGEHFDEDFSASGPGTDELLTEMRWRPLDIEEVPDPPRVWIPYLDQYPFAYAVRLQSAVAGGHEVTVRLFLVADEFFPERRMWIELDKFHHSIVGERSVAVRHARESAVIRKPATKPPGSTRHSPEPPGPGEPREWDAESYCECGWPYNLLLPRGTGEGMRFWMAAVVTDWAKDDLHGSSCGSMSFAARRIATRTPARWAIPFDRRFASADVATALDSLPSIATRSFTIRWTNASFPD